MEREVLGQRTAMATTILLCGPLSAVGVARQESTPEPALQHRPIDCVVAGKYPLIPACFEPRSAYARGRLYFQPAGAADWYYVDLKPGEPCLSGVLPKPKKSLVNTRINYYIDVLTTSMGGSRTPDYSLRVVETEDQCDGLLVAAPSATGPASVYPGLPGGFSAGAGTAAPLAAVGGGAAAAAGVVALVAPSSPASTPPPVTGGPPTSTPGPTPSPSPSPSPDPSPGPSPSPSPPAPTPSPSPTPAATYELRVRKVAIGGGILGSVTSSPAGIACGVLCSNQSATFPNGQIVTLTPQPIAGARFEMWSGACSGTGACAVTVDEDKQAVAHFALLGGMRGPAAEGVSALRVRSTLGVRGGRGEISANGSTAQVREGEAHVVGNEQPGDNLVEARLLEAKGEGFWRFDVAGREPLVPGTLRVIAGEIAGVAAGSVVFRLTGRPGERIAFAWTTVRTEVASLP